jgi:hypothetical protein
MMLARWLADEKGEIAGPSSVLISGSGSSQANGVYTFDGEFEGKGSWRLSEEIVIIWEDDQWKINQDGEGPLYFSEEDTEFPWQVTTWEIFNGEEPVSTVTEIPAANPINNYYSLPEKQLWARIGAEVGDKTEADYLGLPTRYIWRDIYNGVAGSGGTIDWSEKEALGHIAAAYRGDIGNPAALATYINWPWRYQVASIIEAVKPDADTLAFIATSGATDIKAIDGFVKGVKALGLWDSMVAWPLRSSQNAGTGTTAYSLGGLGTFSGTLVNGPTWGVDGITKANANETINVTGTNSALRNSLSLFACFKSSAASNNQRPFACQDGTTAGNYWQLDFSFDIDKRLHTTTSRNSLNSATPNVDPTGRETLFNYWGAALASTEAQGFTNGTAGTLQTGLAARNPVGTPNVDMLGTVSAPNTRGTLSIAVAITLTLSGAQMTDFYTLYKQTLGNGLGLP